MDDATRAELSALRRRAYGPAADIAEDPAALARLAELEDLARPPGADTSASPDSPDPPSWESASHPHRRWPIAFAATAAVALIALAALVVPRPQPSSPPEKPTAVATPIHVPVMIRDTTGTYVDLSWRPEAPRFPVDGEMAWAQPLGEYYGWTMWIGAAASGGGNQSCLLIAGASNTRARCVDDAMRSRGDLAMSLPAGHVEPADRPAGMTEDQRLRFSWGGGGYVTVEVISRIRD